MSPTPEDKAREQIDRMLEQAGWHVCDYKNANICAGTGVVIRNFPLKPCHGTADYLFYIEGRAAGIIEAKKEGTTLTGVEIQSDNTRTVFQIFSLPGIGLCPSAMNQLASKRGSLITLILTLARAVSFPSTILRPLWRG